MTEIPTVKVHWDNPQGFAYINRSEYDESVHELYDEHLTANNSGEATTDNPESGEQPTKSRRAKGRSPSQTEESGIT